MVFFYAFARFDAPVARFWTFLARDRRVLERGGGAAARSSFFHLGWFFPLVMMMPIAMCSDIVALLSLVSLNNRKKDTPRRKKRKRARGWCACSFRVESFGSEEDDVL